MFNGNGFAALLLLLHAASTMSDNKVNNGPQADKPRRYVWPWFVLAALLVGILLAVVWLSSEIDRTRRIRDANNPTSSAPR